MTAPAQSSTRSESTSPSNGTRLSDAPIASAARYPEDVRASDVVRVLRDDNTLDPATDPKLEGEQVLGLYRAMVRTRMLDDRLVANDQ